MVANAKYSNQIKRASMIFGVTLVMAALVLLLRGAGYLMPLELMNYDAMVRWLPHDDEFASKFLLVTLDEVDVEKMQGYPVTDQVMARVLRNLLRPGAEPAAIGVDIYRDKQVPPSDDQTIPPGRQQLDAVLADPRIVVAWRFADRRLGVPPPASLRDKPYQLGFSNEVVDPDGVIRRVLITARATWHPDEPEQQYASLDFLLALRYLKQAAPEVSIGPSGPNDQQMFGPTVLWKIQSDWGGYVGGATPKEHDAEADMALDVRGYQYMPDQRGSRSFQTVHFRDVLAGKLEDEDTAGRVVLIGVTDPTMHDYHMTPRHANQPGVVLQALEVEQLIRAAMGQCHPVRAFDNTTELWLTIAVVTCGAIIGVLIGSPMIVAMILIGGSAVCLGLGWTVMVGGWWLPTAPMTLGWIGATILGNQGAHHRERADRRLVMGLFRSHVDSDLAEYIWAHRDEVLHEGHLRNVEMTASILFVDLVGYSSKAGASRDRPGEVIEWLNQFHEALVTQVKCHSGVVYQFLGDQIVALFGPPVPASPTKQKQDAHRCARCALSMRQAMRQLNQTRSDKGQEPLKIRVGLYTGPLVAGSIGDLNRQTYAVVGDSVNIAARLESYDKQKYFTEELSPHSCRIILGDIMADYLDSAYNLHRIGPVELHNIAQPVEAFALVSGPTQTLKLEGVA